MVHAYSGMRIIIPHCPATVWCDVLKFIHAPAADNRDCSDQREQQNDRLRICKSYSFRGQVYCEHLQKHLLQYSYQFPLQSKCHRRLTTYGDGSVADFLLLCPIGA